jgi:hypothetical protein
MRCAHCDTRIEEGEPFSFRGHHFCCECMLTLCSWFLDGGRVEDPDQFAYVMTDHPGLAP